MTAAASLRVGFAGTPEFAREALAQILADVQNERPPAAQGRRRA